MLPYGMLNACLSSMFVANQKDRELNARTLDDNALKENISRAARSVQDGDSPEAPVKVLIMPRCHIDDWLDRFRCGGWDVWKASPIPGRPHWLMERMIRRAYQTSVRSDHHGRTTWAPKWKTLVVRSSGQRFGLNWITAIHGKGLLRFMVVTGMIFAEVFCGFLRRYLHKFHALPG